MTDAKPESMSTDVKRALNGMRGVHLVAAEVAVHGYAPVVTMRNTPFADVLAQPLVFDGAPLAISVKYGQEGSFFLLGNKLPPRNPKAFYVLVLEVKGKPIRYWVVPSRDLADSPTTKSAPGARRADTARPGYLGLHEGRWGYEVYTAQLTKYEGAWELLKRSSRE